MCHVWLGVLISVLFKFVRSQYARSRAYTGLCRFGLNKKELSVILILGIYEGVTRMIAENSWNHNKTAAASAYEEQL